MGVRNTRTATRKTSRQKKTAKKAGKKPARKLSKAPSPVPKQYLIQRVRAREILDSRGNPTVEADVTLAAGAFGRAAVPSGASTGIHEAVELRDGTKAYGGKGVMKAVAHVNVVISRKLRNRDARDQATIDEAMLSLDGTPNKSRLGANAILAVSIAVSRAAAVAEGKEYYAYLSKLAGKKPRLPIPFCNIINGGKHADGKLMPQEFMVVPIGAKTFAEATQFVSETYHALKGLLKRKYGASATHVGDEGGFAPPLATPEEALDIIMDAIIAAGHERKMAIALDPAASEFCHKLVYDLGGAGKFRPEPLVRYWLSLLKKYPIISLEDPFEQDDFLSWHMLSHRIKEAKLKLQVVGDDLTVTNTKRIRQAIDEGLCNALLLKVNQIGSLTEAIAAATMAFDAGWNVTVSHRSGETEDPFIADLSVALGCGQIKIGAPCRSDRTAKYNQLLRIEEHLGRKARYARFVLPSA